MDIATDDEASKVSNNPIDQEDGLAMETGENEQFEDELKRQFDQLELDEKAMTEKVDEFQSILNHPRSDDQAFKIKEQVIYRLARIFTETKLFNKVVELLKSCGSFFLALPKARTAKIVRNILNIVAEVPDSNPIQIHLCKEVVEWCKAEKRTFLRQRIEARLASLLLQEKEPVQALAISDDLLSELRKLDDKQMLTEVHLTEARIYHSLRNIPKSKASLTASRTAANAIYVVPLLQAEIDEMSGILLCEETDYNTAYSYFLEAFDAYDQANNAKSAVSCLKYMILCKVLNEAAGEVPSLLSSKIGLKHAGKDLEAMAAVAKAAKSRSLEDFKEVVAKYTEYLHSDDLIAHHLEMLYDKMLESNLLKIIHPYCVVELQHVANLIKLPEHDVVQKLSQMILDHKFYGILDQGKGHLIIYESSSEDSNFSKAVDIITNIGVVVDTLSTRAKTLSKVPL